MALKAYQYTKSQFAHNLHTSLPPDVEAVVKGGPIYTTHEVTSTAQALMKHKHAACTQKRCQNTHGTISKSTLAC